MKNEAHPTKTTYSFQTDEYCVHSFPIRHIEDGANDFAEMFRQLNDLCKTAKKPVSVALTKHEWEFDEDYNEYGIVNTETLMLTLVVKEEYGTGFDFKMTKFKPMEV